MPAETLKNDSSFGVSAVLEPPDPVILAGQIDLNALFARQASTLEEAAARYSLKTNRPPPREPS
jgi:hypothetical protein